MVKVWVGSWVVVGLLKVWFGEWCTCISEDVPMKCIHYPSGQCGLE